MPAPPLVAGVRVMFTENPFLSYDVGVKVTPGLPPMRLDVVPGLNTLLKNIIGLILRDKIVFPVAVAVPVADLLVGLALFPSLFCSQNTVQSMTVSIACPWNQCDASRE